ncbi:hypothetical protein E2C01_040083 [Portunus trituberculatus]|uniref:Uncharacterized protein n=1 Tax=Portunus trituberculatus TaxID=210409 RepID=A0A5B7FPS0_PORTR|nr:hypothetical protein [Portunus trituberculatus]
MSICLFENRHFQNGLRNVYVTSSTGDPPRLDPDPDPDLAPSRPLLGTKHSPKNSSTASSLFHSFLHSPYTPTSNTIHSLPGSHTSQSTTRSTTSSLSQSTTRSTV